MFTNPAQHVHSAAQQNITQHAQYRARDHHITINPITVTSRYNNILINTLTEITVRTKLSAHIHAQTTYERTHTYWIIWGWDG